MNQQKQATSYWGLSSSEPSECASDQSWASPPTHEGSQLWCFELAVDVPPEAAASPVVGFAASEAASPG